MNTTRQRYLMLILTFILTACNATPKQSIQEQTQITAEITHDLCGPILVYKSTYGSYPTTYNDLKKTMIELPKQNIIQKYHFYPKGLPLHNSDRKIILINRSITHNNSFYGIAMAPNGNLSVRLFSEDMIQDAKK